MSVHLVDDDAGLTRILRDARTVAVLGAKPMPHEPAHYVPRYLHDRGYRIRPVNPIYAGQTIFGETVVATLAELDEAVDVIDVFRRPQYLPGHLDRLAAIDADLRDLPGITHAGAGYRGVGIPDCIRQGTEAANRVLDALSTQT